MNNTSIALNTPYQAAIQHGILLHIGTRHGIQNAVCEEERQIAVVASNPFLVDFGTENRHSANPTTLHHTFMVVNQSFLSVIQTLGVMDEVKRSEVK